MSHPPPPPSEAPSYHTVQPSYPLDTYPSQEPSMAGLRPRPEQHEQVKIYSMHGQNMGQNTGAGYDGQGVVPGQDYGFQGGYQGHGEPVYGQQQQQQSHGSSGKYYGQHDQHGSYGNGHGQGQEHGGKYSHSGGVGGYSGGQGGNGGQAGQTVVVVKKGHSKGDAAVGCCAGCTGACACCCCGCVVM